MEELTAAGCDIVRVACPTDKDAEALPIIAISSPASGDLPTSTSSRMYVVRRYSGWLRCRRVNPGNIRSLTTRSRKSAQMVSDHGTSLRIGVNAGSLDNVCWKYGDTRKALVSPPWEASLKEYGFHDFKISVKHNDPVVMVEAYRQLAERGDWPLHLA